VPDLEGGEGGSSSVGGGVRRERDVGVKMDNADARREGGGRAGGRRTTKDASTFCLTSILFRSRDYVHRLKMTRLVYFKYN
jgi:hypothetical protein